MDLTVWFDMLCSNCDTSLSLTSSTSLLCQTCLSTAFAWFCRWPVLWSCSTSGAWPAWPPGWLNPWLEDKEQRNHTFAAADVFSFLFFLNYLCGFFCLARIQECRIALAPPDGRLYISVSEPHWCSCQSSVAARPCRITDRGQTVEDRLLGNLTDETVFFFKFKVFLN